jgi:hypothetical protein
MQITNELGLPQPFVDAVSSEYQYKPKRYSVTAVLKGTREMMLQRRHADEITSDVADMVWMIFGSAVHSILERSHESDTQLKENWVSMEMPNGYTLSGIFDLYDDATGTVTDYKTATVWKVIYDEWDDYRKQTLAYCCILRSMGFDARRGEIVALLKDHSKSKAEHDSSYPQHPVYRIGWDFTEDDIAEMNSWLEARFIEIEAAEKLPDNELPMCTDEERWAKPDKWALMKNGRKSAVKLYDNERDACDASNANGKGYYVEHRRGEDVKCEKYCSACQFCDYFRENYGEKC